MIIRISFTHGVNCVDWGRPIFVMSVSNLNIGKYGRVYLKAVRFYS